MSSVAPLLARNWRAKSIHNCIIYLHERILTLCLISAYLGNPGFLLQKNSFSAHDIHSTKSHTNCYKIFQQRSHLRACLYPPHTCVWWENLRSLSTNCEYRLKTSSGQRAEWMGVRGWCCKDKNVADLTRSAPETGTVHWKRALCRNNFLACYRFDCRGLASSAAFVHREISQPPTWSLQLQQTWISPIFIVFSPIFNDYYICQGICSTTGCFIHIWSVNVLPEQRWSQFKVCDG